MRKIINLKNNVIKINLLIKKAMLHIHKATTYSYFSCCKWVNNIFVEEKVDSACG